MMIIRMHYLDSNRFQSQVYLLAGVLSLSEICYGAPHAEAAPAFGKVCVNLGSIGPQRVHVGIW